jgi:AcrR family transcriptional regulator
MEGIDLKKERERKRREANKETILHAAESVIIRKGVRAATMDDIARESQFSKATLYQYFPGKSGLVDDIVLHYHDDVRKLMERVVDRDLPAAEKLRRIIRTSIEFHDAKENISRVLMADEDFRDRMKAFLSHGQGDLSSEEKRFFRSVFDKLRTVLDIVTAVIREGVRNREFREMDVEACGAFLSAAVMGFFHDYGSSVRRLSPRARSGIIMEFLLNGIAAAPDSRKGVSI